MKKYLLLILFYPLYAFPQQISITHFSTEDGLPHSQIQALIQDNKANLWIGTMSGLTKYNGKDFITYTKKDGLAEEWVTSLFKDNKGNIWIGHWAGGITVLNVEVNKFINLFFEKYSNYSSISSFVQDNDNNVWIASKEGALFKYDTKKELINKINTIKANNIFSLEKDNFHHICVGTDKGIYLLDEKNNDKVQFLNLNSKVLLIKNIKNDALLVSTQTQGIFIAKQDRKLLKKESFIYLSDKKINATLSCVQDEKNNLWLCINDIGVVKYDSDGNLLKIYNSKSGLNYDGANCIFKDRENNIWIGTDIGLNLYRDESFLLYNKKNGLPHNLVWSVYEDSKRNLWVGTNKGVAKKELNSNQFTLYPYQATSNDKFLKDYAVLSIFEDDKGNMWFGTKENGLFLLFKNNYFIHYSTQNFLPDNTVYSINQDKQGYVWIATKQGALKYDYSSNKFKLFNKENGLGGNFIHYIYIDSNDRIWFAVLGGELTMLENDKFKTFNENDSLNSKFILSINEDNKGNLWFGTYGQGLYLFKNNTFKNYNMDNGLNSNIIYSIISDQNDNLWLGTSSGLDMIDFRKNKFIHYGKKEGFLGIETNTNAVVKDSKGNIWFGTIMGLVKYNPYEIKNNKVEPVISYLKLNINSQDSILPSNKILSYKQNNITFNFLAVSLSSPSKVLYKYRLNGFEKKWHISKTNFANYTNLPAGKYTFELYASINSTNQKVWTKKAKKIHFTIKAPFWQNHFFYAAVILFLALLIYFGDKIRTKNLKSTNKILEEKIIQLKNEIAQKNKY